MTMRTAFENALGDPEIFLEEIVSLKDQYLQLSGQRQLDFESLREFVNARQGELLKDAKVFRCVAGAFACILIDFYAQKIRASGFLRKKLFVTSRHYRGEFVDLFYRCMYEGLDLAPKGDGLPS